MKRLVVPAALGLGGCGIEECRIVGGLDLIAIVNETDRHSSSKWRYEENEGQFLRFSYQRTGFAACYRVAAGEVEINQSKSVPLKPGEFLRKGDILFIHEGESSEL